MRKLAFLALLLITVTATAQKPTTKEIDRWQRSENLVIQELLESYYITVENPDNNEPGEQDSIVTLLRRVEASEKTFRKFDAENLSICFDEYKIIFEYTGRKVKTTIIIL